MNTTSTARHFGTPLCATRVGCPRCRFGRVVILGGGARRTITCVCPAGRAIEADQRQAALRDALVAAFIEVCTRPVSGSTR